MSWTLEELSANARVMRRTLLTPGTWVIGRSDQCDWVLDDPHAAPVHAHVVVQSDPNADLQVHAMPSRNGMAWRRGKGFSQAAFQSGAPNERAFFVGNTAMRVRHSTWPLADEQPLSRRTMWPWAFLAVLVVMSQVALDIWVDDNGNRSQPYLNAMASVGAGLLAWSAMYAVLGRVFTGGDRFFTHVCIAACGYLSVQWVDAAMHQLAFSMAWVWPLRLELATTALVAALTVRQHLRCADPEHWPQTRWAVFAVAILAVAIPTVQRQLSESRWSDMHIAPTTGHPATLVANPASIDALIDNAQALKKTIDQGRNDRMVDPYGVTEP